IIVTADHGNADAMVERDKRSGEVLRRDDGTPKPRTSHSLNPVPCHVWAPGRALRLRALETPGLASVAATVCDLMGFEAPEAFERSLLDVS
ncbi:MAG: 2,3-bisphosphoglycerate-independent phosphoglycerate mutase, partial [Myxococcota bacterium]